ncbi:hypothetical protein [Sphingomonas sp.]|uniref:hypothetical protein n=1 Tax=Sphingomonas sp. TaxID=28214 RepID=UPI00286E0E86|nr:hypothetical protein [Sphingomonas sp.]
MRPPPTGQIILAIGATPPPLGGVTVFLERWIAQARAHGAIVHHLDPRRVAGNPVAAVVALMRRYDRIVLNGLKPIAVLVAKALHPLTTVAVVDHNASRAFKYDRWWTKPLRRLALRLADEILVVSPHLRVNYPAHQAKISEIGTFLPPDGTRKDAVAATYGAETRRLAEPGEGPVMITAAWRPVEENGKDLYGLADSARLLRRLRKSLPDARLIVFIGDPLDNSVWQEFSALSEAPDLAGHLAVETGQKEFWPLLSSVDMMLRLTATDGNSVSIHEAQWAGCPVVASDVVPRPAGVYTYQHGNMDDLEQKVLDAWRAKVASR